jgi:hypothetical protein
MIKHTIFDMLQSTSFFLEASVGAGIINNY